MADSPKSTHTLFQTVYDPTNEALQVSVVSGGAGGDVTVINPSSDPVPVAVVSGGAGGDVTVINPSSDPVPVAIVSGGSGGGDTTIIDVDISSQSTPLEVSIVNAEYAINVDVQSMPTTDVNVVGQDYQLQVDVLTAPTTDVNIVGADYALNVDIASAPTLDVNVVGQDYQLQVDVLTAPTTDVNIVGADYALNVDIASAPTIDVNVVGADYALNVDVMSMPTTTVTWASALPVEIADQSYPLNVEVEAWNAGDLTVDVDSDVLTSMQDDGQASMTDSSSQIVAANASRKTGVLLYNTGSNPVFITEDTAATTSNFKLLAKAWIFLPTQAELNGICASGRTTSVSYFEG